MSSMRIRLIPNEYDSEVCQKSRKKRSLLSKIVNERVFYAIVKQNGTESFEAMKEVCFYVWWTITGSMDYM